MNPGFSGSGLALYKPNTRMLFRDKASLGTLVSEFKDALD